MDTLDVSWFRVLFLVGSSIVMRGASGLNGGVLEVPAGLGELGDSGTSRRGEQRRRVSERKAPRSRRISVVCTFSLNELNQFSCSQSLSCIHPMSSVTINATSTYTLVVRIVTATVCMFPSPIFSLYRIQFVFIISRVS